MNMLDLKTHIEELAPKVAAWIAQGRKPRALTQDEKRLSISDPKAFEAVVSTLQGETLVALREEAAFETLQGDLAKAQDAERLQVLAKVRTERDELLALRYEAATELDAAFADIDAALKTFLDLNVKISGMDRDLGEQDRHRASHGIVSMGLTRALKNNAPTLWKAAGIPIPMMGSGSGRALSDMCRPEGYDWQERNTDPLEN